MQRNDSCKVPHACATKTVVGTYMSKQPGAYCYAMVAGALKWHSSKRSCTSFFLFLERAQWDHVQTYRSRRIIRETIVVVFSTKQSRL